MSMDVEEIGALGSVASRQPKQIEKALSKIS